MKIRDLIKITGAKIISGKIDENLDVKISTDTRTIQKGDFYLPLKGASFDGEKFINQALEKGAVGAFCTTNYLSLGEENFSSQEFVNSSDRKIGEGWKNSILLQVPNTLTAYLQLANFRRRQKDFTVVAITGSSGKTTTKELVASTLSSKYKVFKTPLNHNNEIGFCQTVFETPDDTEVLVLEMGMRGLGEIELLSKYAEPDITIICNVGTAHIGRLGSRENIAKAKCEIVKYQRGNVFIAHDDELIRKTVDFKGEKIFYSIKEVNILGKRVDYSKFEYNGNVYELKVGGDYNIENALSAINTGVTLGLTTKEIQDGLKKYHPIEKRWEKVNKGGFEIINDSYNANPESMRAFIDTIFEFYDNFALILGDMGELGANSIEYHKELGEYINSHKKLKHKTTVIAVGELSKNIIDEIKNCTSIHFETIEQAVEYIKNNINKETKLFLKASRTMNFERIIDLL